MAKEMNAADHRLSQRAAKGAASVEGGRLRPLSYRDFLLSCDRRGGRHCRAYRRISHDEMLVGDLLTVHGCGLQTLTVHIHKVGVAVPAQLRPCWSRRDGSATMHSAVSASTSAPPGVRWRSRSRGTGRGRVGVLLDGAGVAQVVLCWGRWLELLPCFSTARDSWLRAMIGTFISGHNFEVSGDGADLLHAARCAGRWSSAADSR